MILCCYFVYCVEGKWNMESQETLMKNQETLIESQETLMESQETLMENWKTLMESWDSNFRWMYDHYCVGLGSKFV